jgi:repressor LexA
MQTKKQDLTNKIKHFIEEYYGQHGTSPSIRCIAENVGCSKSNVTIYIDYLKEQGLLEIGEDGYETEVTRATETNVVAVPRLGYVPCGPLSEEYECIDGYVRLPASFVGNAKKCFLLTACGNSMIDAGIHDGDLVLVRQQETANYNDIVVALVDNEVTLKRYRPDLANRRIILHPENKRMKDIEVEECKIQGVATKVIKNLES